MGFLGLSASHVNMVEILKLGLMGLNNKRDTAFH